MKYLALSYERSDHDAIDSIDTKSTIAIDKDSRLKYEERWAGFCVLETRTIPAAFNNFADKIGEKNETN